MTFEFPTPPAEAAVIGNAGHKKRCSNHLVSGALPGAVSVRRAQREHPLGQGRRKTLRAVSVPTRLTGRGFQSSASDNSRSPFTNTAGMAGFAPIVAVPGPASERPFRRISDVPINLFELNSGADASGKPGAVQFANCSSKPSTGSAILMRRHPVAAVAGAKPG